VEDNEDIGFLLYTVLRKEGFDAVITFTIGEALTAFSDPDTYARALAAGCREYASKPIEMKDLGEVIARNLRAAI
jgi:DNA-binding response OmpR family regulator